MNLDPNQVKGGDTATQYQVAKVFDDYQVIMKIIDDQRLHEEEYVKDNGTRPCTPPAIVLAAETIHGAITPAFTEALGRDLTMDDLMKLLPDVLEGMFLTGYEAGRMGVEFTQCRCEKERG